jgi:hypothetical protein
MVDWDEDPPWPTALPTVVCRMRAQAALGTKCACGLPRNLAFLPTDVCLITSSHSVFRRTNKSHHLSSLDVHLCCHVCICSAQQQPHYRTERNFTPRVYSFPQYPVEMSTRPVVSPSTPGPGLAILCLCSAAASAVVAGTSVAYQAKLKRTRLQDLEINWNVLLGLGLVRT